MSRYAHFDFIKNGVAFSDPWYGEDVRCQYRKDFQDSNWFMKLDSENGKYDSINFMVTLGRPSLAGKLVLEQTEDGFSYRFPAHFRAESVELGIDTARIFFGSLKDFEMFGESAAIHTGGDGLCGDLIVFTVKGENQPAGFVLSCCFDEAFIDEDEFFDRLISSFEGKEITQKAFEHGVDPSRVANIMLLANELRRAEAAKREASGPSKKPASPERE